MSLRRCVSKVNPKYEEMVERWVGESARRVNQEADELSMLIDPSEKRGTVRFL